MEINNTLNVIFLTDLILNSSLGIEKDTSKIKVCLFFRILTGVSHKTIVVAIENLKKIQYVIFYI